MMGAGCCAVCGWWDVLTSDGKMPMHQHNGETCKGSLDAPGSIYRHIGRSVGGRPAHRGRR